jgi:LacI family transcriptional regulator
MKTPPRGTKIASVTFTIIRPGLEVAKGVSDYAYEQGWSVLRLDNHLPLEPSYLQKAGVQGVVIQIYADTPVEPLTNLGLPIVNGDTARPDLKYPCVAPDDYGVGQHAAEHFIQKGFSNFAFCGDQFSYASELRLSGFRERVEAEGYRVNVTRGSFNLPIAYLKENNVATLVSWLRELPRPCAVFGWVDSVCDTILNICRQEAWSVPDEISVLGVNNDFNRLADEADFSLSSVELPGIEVGYRAAQLLGHLIAGGTAPRNAQLLPPRRIVERRSTNFYAVSDPAVVAAMKYIKRHCQEPIDVGQIASSVKLSRRVFEKRFRQHLRSSPYEELMRCRLERAKELLLSTDLKLEEIAGLCGYDTASNFTLFFAKKAGCAPSAYRRRLSGAKAADTWE